MARKTKLSPDNANNKLPEEQKPDNVLPQTLVERGWLSLPLCETATVVHSWDGYAINYLHRFQEGEFLS